MFGVFFKFTQVSGHVCCLWDQNLLHLIQTLPRPTCATSDSLLHLAVSQSPHLQNGNSDSTWLVGLLGELGAITQ